MIALPRRHRRIAAIAGPALLASGAAQAQVETLPPADSIQFSRNVAVRDRQLPGYDPLGLPLGGLTLYPSIEVSANTTDNIFAVENNRASDVFVRLQPTARLQSDWSNRSLTLSATGTLDRYASHASENVDAINLNAGGSQELGGNTQVRASGRFVSNRESRESENAFALTDRPVHYTDIIGAIGVSKRFGGLLAAVDAGIQGVNFDNATLRGGGVLDQAYRDGTVKQIRGRVDAIQTPALSYFGQLTYTLSRYSQPSFLGVRRGAATAEALIGARFDLPVLMRGEVGVGYIDSSYKDDRFRRFQGLAFNTRVTFFPTELTNVTVDAQRSVNDAGTPDSSTYVTSAVGLRLDHELLRTLILGIQGNYETDTFNGVDRRDRRRSAGASVDWRLNRLLTMRFNVDRLELTSVGTARYKSFTRDRALLGIGVRL